METIIKARLITLKLQRAIIDAMIEALEKTK